MEPVCRSLFFLCTFFTASRYVSISANSDEDFPDGECYRFRLLCCLFLIFLKFVFESKILNFFFSYLFSFSCLLLLCLLYPLCFCAKYSINRFQDSGTIIFYNLGNPIMHLFLTLTIPQKYEIAGV